jgi:enoyl-CoA hydratase/carnithine racemase
MADQICRYKTLSLERKGHVAVLTILGYGGEDAIVTTLAAELVEVCGDIGFDEEIRALVMTMSQTIDVPPVSIPRANDMVVYTEMASSPFFRAADSIASLGFPTIAAIRGDLAGFGLELAMACDIRITSVTSWFGMPQIRHGLIPCHGGTQRLPRLVGKAKAMEMILTGDPIDAQEALRVGLVTKMVPLEEVAATALDMAERMTTKGPVALRYVKEAIHKGTDLTLDQGLRMEGDLYLLICSTSDRVEGVEAFRQKRKPEFHGK